MFIPPPTGSRAVNPAMTLDSRLVDATSFTIPQPSSSGLKGSSWSCTFPSLQSLLASMPCRCCASIRFLPRRHINTQPTSTRTSNKATTGTTPAGTTTPTSSDSDPSPGFVLFPSLFPADASAGLAVGVSVPSPPGIAAVFEYNAFKHELH
ncbi:hypothetical protein BJX62DRAFT_208363 [Aspergillus germanicus]